MLLVLNGEVSVETAEPGHDGEHVDISALGPGNLIGEMGLLDGAPRSVTCVAATRVDAGGLSREALELLFSENPKVGAKLMTAIAKRLADRLRAAGDQLRIYSQLVADMQREINAMKRRAL